MDPYMTTKSRSNASLFADNHVLLVDGDDNDLFYISILLQRFECAVFTSKTAGVALESTAVARPILVITAQNLPDMSGFELIQRLRQDPGTADVPVIVLTHADDFIAEKSCLDAGAAYLAKPVQAEELYRTVQSAVESTPRAYIRVPTSLPVAIDGIQLAHERGECVSLLSEQGMYVRTLMPQQPRTLHSVQIRIRDRIISLDVMVLYRQAFRDGLFKEPGMGLKFIRISPEGQEFIRQYIREEVTKGIVPAGQKESREKDHRDSPHLTTD